MQLVKLMGFISLLLISLTSAGCDRVGKETDGCMAIIDWVDFLMINGITYDHNNEGTKEVAKEQIGDKISEITYMLNDHACTDHKSKNGDAAYLPVGTAVYELKGYKPEYRVVANNKIYEVHNNPNAATIGELLDIENKVDKVSLESGYDGSPIGDFSAAASTEFIRELLPLAYVGFDEVYPRIKHETGYFLRVHLKDGTSFRMVYYPKANAFNPGAYGTETLKELIVSERTRIKAAAGM